MIAKEYLSTDLSAPASPARTLWRIYTLLGALQGLAAAFLIFQTRSAEAGRLPGLSTTRLVLTGIVVLVSAWLVWLFLETWLRPAGFARRWSRLTGRLSRRRNWSMAFLASAALLFLSLTWVGVSPGLQEAFARAIFQRLQPLAVWIAGLSFLTLIGLLVLRHGRDLWALRPRQPLFYILLVFFAGVLLAWSWAARAVLPVEGGRLGWNRQGVPLVETQLFLAWFLGLGMAGLLAVLQNPSGRLSRLRPRWFDLLIAVVIWLAAVIAWQSVPLLPNWFVSQPTHPNFEYYPSSDARAYDTSAQTALIGVGYRFYNAPYVRRSLLALYLTVLHLVGGQQYDRVVFLQILVLALIPVLIYFITRAIHNRISGVMAAALVILREVNSITLAGDITTSNAKLLMADLPAMLMALLVALLVILWLQRIDQNPLLALAAGGALGFSMLIRLETVVFIAPAALIAALILWPKKCYKLWLQSGLLALLGIGLVLAPWVWRNYRQTGEIFIDHPYFSMGLLIQRFNPSPELQQPIEPGEGGEFNFTAPTQPAGAVTTPTGPTPTPGVAVEILERESGKAVDYIVQNRAQVLAILAGHMLNSQVQSFLVLPTTFRGLDSSVDLVAHRSLGSFWAACCSAEGYVHRLPYWRQWDGRFPAETLLPLALNLLLIVFGVTQSWKRNGWAGLAPLFFGITYIVFNGALRNSGGRYMLPVDWIYLVYFSTGLAAVTTGLFHYLAGRSLPETLPADAAPARPGITPGSLLRSPRFYLLAGAILLLACTIPLVEASLPMRYSQARQQEMLQSLLSSDQVSPDQRKSLETFLSNGAVTLAGRALYPRYFPPNQGDDVSKRNPLSPRPYPRMVFYLASLNSMNMMVPIAEKPLSFPNASDVLIIACPERDILALARFSGSGSLKMVYVRSPFPENAACPLPPEELDKKKKP
jgi:hypothetical protein